MFATFEYSPEMGTLDLCRGPAKSVRHCDAKPRRSASVMSSHGTGWSICSPTRTRGKHFQLRWFHILRFAYAQMLKVHKDTNVRSWLPDSQHAGRTGCRRHRLHRRSSVQFGSLGLAEVMGSLRLQQGETLLLVKELPAGQRESRMQSRRLCPCVLAFLRGDVQVLWLII